MLSLNRVVEGDFSEKDLPRVRAAIKSKSPEETLLGIYRASNRSSANAKLQHSTACLCTSACVPCFLPCACYLPFEHGRAAEGALTFVTDRAIYRLVGEHVDRQTPLLHCVQGSACASFIQPPTGLTSGEIPLNRVEALGTSLSRLQRLDGSGTVSQRNSPGTFSWCVCCPVHYVAIAVQPSTPLTPTSKTRVAPADSTGLRSFILYTGDADSAMAAEGILRQAAEAARSGAGPLADSSGLSKRARAERVRTLSMDRPDGALIDDAAAPDASVPRRDRKRSVSFENIVPADFTPGEGGAEQAADAYPMNPTELYTEPSKGGDTATMPKKSWCV